MAPTGRIKGQPRTLSTLHASNLIHCSRIESERSFAALLRFRLPVGCHPIWQKIGAGGGAPGVANGEFLLHENCIRRTYSCRPQITLMAVLRVKFFVSCGYIGSGKCHKLLLSCYGGLPWS